MKLILIAWLTFFLLWEGLTAQTPKILILYNKKVPTGKDLVYDYIEHHQLSSNVMLGLDLPPHPESITMDTYLNCFENELERRFANDRPEIILTVYGLPLWVEDGNRLRSLDQLLVLGEGAANLDERLILNPLLQSPVPEFATNMVKVCRLDGPTLRYAKAILEQWKMMSNVGCWRRYGLSGVDEDIAHMMKQRGFWVEMKPALNLMPLNELQFFDAHQGKVRELMELHPKEQLSPGAMILRHHSSSFQDGDFRSNGDSDAAAACLLGASFYVGAQKTQRPEEDLFDPLLFFLRFSKGASFAEAAYRAMPNLGGSLLVLGDPLAKPFNAKSIAKQRQYFENNQLREPTQAQLNEFNHAKDWWLSREYFQMWNKGNVEMVIANLKMAIHKRRSPLFFEHLSKRYKQLGKQEEMKPWLNKWPKDKRSPWDQHVLEMMGY